LYLESIRHIPAIFAKISKNQLKLGYSVAKAKNNLTLFMAKSSQELPIIQKTYDLILWLTPIINRLPRQYKFTLGDRMQSQIYDILEELIYAKFEKNKLNRLEKINVKLDILRFQIKLIYDFKMINGKKYLHISNSINEIGTELGSWINQQQSVTKK
jgi:hypothetical protein